MSWNDLEKSFLNAWSLAFARRKLILCFFSLALCGILMVFCRALAKDAGSWMNLSLIFLPILLSSGFLLTLGVLLVRMYVREIKGLTLDLKKLFTGSLEIAISTSYLSFPPVIIYLVIWVLLGLFFLLKEIPMIGPFFNIVLAFGPFLLIFCCLLLCLLTVGLLFFVVPAVAHHSIKRLELWLQIWKTLQQRPFQSAILFLMGILPSLFMAGMLSTAAAMTNLSFAMDQPSAALALEWFFVMLPFCALLAPPVIFFFHFAAESYQLLRR